MSDRVRAPECSLGDQPRANRVSQSLTVRLSWRWLAIYAPVLVAVVFFVPRVVKARFGLLDDGVTISVARAILGHPAVALHAYAGAGRFLPCYWIYNAFCYAVDGSSPAVFYLGNLLLLALTLAMLIALMRRLGATGPQIWVGALLFFFSRPTTEAYFTLSKNELIATFAVLAVLLLAHIAQANNRGRVWWAVGLLMLVAFTTKETNFALAGVFPAWLLVAYWDRFGTPIHFSRRGLWICSGLAALGAAAVGIARTALGIHATAGTYASHYQLDLKNLILAVQFWSFSLVRDFPLTLVFLLVAAVLAWQGKLREKQVPLLMLLWMAGFGAVLMPWGMLSHYLVMFNLGNAVFCGFVAGELLATARTEHWARVVLMVAGLGFIVVAINNISMARRQILVDEANAGLMERLSRLPQSTIVYVNWPASHEYFFELRLQMKELYGRPDIGVEPLTFSAPDKRDSGQASYVIALVQQNQPWPDVRGPMQETALASWQHEWEGFGGVRTRVVAESIRSQQLVDIGLQAAWCMPTLWISESLAGVLCTAIPRPPIDLREAKYGWKLYAYPEWKSVHPAVFLDDGSWLIEEDPGKQVRITLGARGDLPLAGDWDGEGMKEIGVYRPATNTWLLDLNMDGNPERSFRLPSMRPTDRPVTGDWAGNGKTGFGFFRPEDGTWHLFNSWDSPAEDIPVFRFGNRDDVPLAGDWENRGRSTPGVYNPASGNVTLLHSFREDGYRSEFTLAAKGNPFVANWSGAGTDIVNVAVHGKWVRRFANCNCEASNPPPEPVSQLPDGQYFVAHWRSTSAKQAM